MSRVPSAARRARVLSGIALLASLVALAYVARPQSARRRLPRHPSVSARSTSTAFSIPKENARSGTRDWRILAGTPRTLDGYADHVSAQVGDVVTLYVSTPQPSFRVDAYRMGWYQGLGARLVWRSRSVRGVVQSRRTIIAPTRTVTTRWKPSLKVPITSEWPPGDYLLKLVDGSGQSYVPLTVRDDASRAAVLVMNAVTTWQAYNDWGGYDLYNGPLDDPRLRSKVVSFDRPYANSGADEFVGNELGLVTVVERMGLDVSYTTDVDVHAHPERIRQHRVLVSLGHDEYWSPEMRAGVQAARDHGVNLIFLGANAVFRRIRLQPSVLGAYRLEVNYRVARDDPLFGIDNAQVTTDWREMPTPRPESTLTGLVYECNPVDVAGVVADATSWVFDRTGLHNGDHVPHLIGTEYDRVNPQAPTPRNIEVLFHSPLTCGNLASFSDAAFYTAPSGADVFDAGTGAWTCKLYTGCPKDTPPRPDTRIVRITENILRVFAAGPAGPLHPATSNLATLGIHAQGIGASDSPR